MKRVRTIVAAVALAAALVAAPGAAFAGLGDVNSPRPLTSQAGASSLEPSDVEVWDASWLQIFLTPLLNLLST